LSRKIKRTRRKRKITNFVNGRNTKIKKVLLYLLCTSGWDVTNILLLFYYFGPGKRLIGNERTVFDFPTPIFNHFHNKMAFVLRNTKQTQNLYTVTPNNYL